MLEIFDRNDSVCFLAGRVNVMLRNRKDLEASKRYQIVASFGQSRSLGILWGHLWGHNRVGTQLKLYKTMC